VKLWDFEKEDDLFEHLKDFLFGLYFRYVCLKSLLDVLTM